MTCFPSARFCSMGQGHLSLQRDENQECLKHWPAEEPSQEGAEHRNLLFSINELVECILGDNVATDKPDGRVEIQGLLAEDGAGEHQVVPALHT